MNRCSVKNEILRAAGPYLAGRIVTDLVIGVALAGVQLDDGSVGAATVLLDALPPERGDFGRFAEDIIGRSAAEAAEYFTAGTDDVQRAVGAAVLIAASSHVSGLADDNSEDVFGITLSENDVVGMIGLIRPVARRVRTMVKDLIVFDAGLSAFGDCSEVYPMSMQPELLPKCRKMIITGSAVTNGSIDGLLEMCSSAEEIVMVGPSVPMFAEGWRGTKVTRLAGSVWKPECKDSLFRAISLGGGVRYVQDYSLQKIVYM